MSTVALALLGSRRNVVPLYKQACVIKETFECEETEKTCFFLRGEKECWATHPTVFRGHLWQCSRDHMCCLKSKSESAMCKASESTLAISLQHPRKLFYLSWDHTSYAQRSLLAVVLRRRSGSPRIEPGLWQCRARAFPAVLALQPKKNILETTENYSNIL